MAVAISSKTKTIMSVAFVLILGTALLTAVIYLVKWLVDLLSRLPPQMAATIIAALLALVGVLSAQFITGALNRKLEKERTTINRRAETYEKLVKDLMEFFVLHKDKTPKGQTKANDKVISMMTSFGGSAMVWASADVLLAWNNFRHTIMANATTEENLKLLSEVLRQIRKDLGHNQQGKLHDSDLLRTFINDLESGKDF